MTGVRPRDDAMILPFVEELAAHPTCRLLATLDLTNNRIGPQGAAVLAASPALRHLTTLDLTNNRIGDAGAIALARSETLYNLASLNLQNNWLGPSGAAALAASPAVQRVGSLDLSRNQIDDDGALALARAEGLLDLCALYLHENPIGNAGIAALSQSPALHGVTALSIGGGPIGEVGIDALVGGPMLHALTSLRCGGESHHQIGSKIAHGLAEVATPYRLTALVLDEAGVTPAAAQRLVQAESLRELASLSLRGNNLQNAGARALASATLDGLTALDLGDNGINSDGLRVLVSSSAFPRLKILELRANPIGDVGARALATMPWRLEALDLQETAIERGGRARAPWPKRKPCASSRGCTSSATAWARVASRLSASPRFCRAAGSRRGGGARVRIGSYRSRKRPRALRDRPLGDGTR